VHHILPEASGGPDTEENAAPLCPSCHTDFGGNPEKRKTIREMRDFWYELCARRISPEAQDLKGITEMLANVVTKDDLARLSVQNVIYLRGESEGADRVSGLSRFSFVREEYVHPLVVQELLGWLSDPAETIVSIDLVASLRSNRFVGEIVVREHGGRVWVKWLGERGQFFAYAHIATSPSGVEMLECHQGGGGSGIFGHVILLSMGRDRSLGADSAGAVGTKERVLLKTLGSIVVGDRYEGSIEYKDGLLVIAPDDGRFKNGPPIGRKVPVR
jgi:hypothetical protein